MRECSIFVDESGEPGSQSKYYALTLVFHNQDGEIIQSFNKYEQYLAESKLPNIPMHTQPLLNGNGEYQSLPVSFRQRLLTAFFFMTKQLPIKYVTFLYKKSEFNSLNKLEYRIRRDIVVVLLDHAEYLHSFDEVKIYYDGGQAIVSKALRAAVEYSLSHNAVIYRSAIPPNYRLAQVADFICTIELTAHKYQLHEETITDERFFKDSRSFRKNYLKHIRRLSLQ